MVLIHPTSVVDPKAELGDGVEIGPMCYIGPNVKLGDGTKLISQCNVDGHTTIGSHNTLYPMCSLGGDPQDYGFKSGTVSYLKIGNNNTFREGFTAHVGTKEDTSTVIGDNNYFMANSHVAHNCIVGNNVVMVNGALIAGYVEVGNNCLLSGNSLIHQFCKVGAYCVVSGGAGASMDIPPYVILTGRNDGVRNLNIVGLRRNGFSKHAMKCLRDVFKIFYRSDLNTTDAIARIEAEVDQIPEVVIFVDFVKASKRGVVKNYNGNEME